MNTIEIIKTLEKEFIEAMLKSDVKILEKYLHENLIFHIPGGHVVTKEIDLEAHRSGVMKITKISTAEPVITTIEDNLATVSIEVNLMGQYLNQPVDGTFRYLRVWKLCGTDWKVIAGSCNEIN